MNTTEQLVEATLDDLWFDLEDLCRLGVVEACWLEERLTNGLVIACEDAPDTTRCYNHITLTRVRRLAALERDFEAVPELAALVADMECEIQRLKERLQCLED
ncbi:MerR family transcriptional regulator [Aquabacterium soli]|uniref:MerR family transcriptional regulator n=1 Tax=Aquabacterium soli TaxID=2493092 RepID=A0A3R8SBR4_9BURK|nr:MerR family transcriptional regulator [Aquabacterium soli]RRS05967.1 MerR family transcriptional regulator [Aquabacterium soli]